VAAIWAGVWTAGGGAGWGGCCEYAVIAASHRAQASAWVRVWGRGGRVLRRVNINLFIVKVGRSLRLHAVISGRVSVWF